jgi:cystathionine gamma-synthase
MGATFVLKVDFSNGIHIMENFEKTCTSNEIYAVVYPQDLAKEAKAFWQHTGFGVSSRRATYWFENAPFLHQGSSSSATDLPNQEAEDAKLVVQQRIADLLSTETNSLDVDDVFLYPSGMSAIAHTADTVRYFTTPTKRTVAIFGYVNLELAATP